MKYAHLKKENSNSSASAAWPSAAPPISRVGNGPSMWGLRWALHAATWSMSAWCSPAAPLPLWKTAPSRNSAPVRFFIFHPDLPAMIVGWWATRRTYRCIFLVRTITQTNNHQRCRRSELSSETPGEAIARLRHGLPLQIESGLEHIIRPAHVAPIVGIRAKRQDFFSLAGQPQIGG